METAKPRPLYNRIAMVLSGIQNCRKSGNKEWEEKHLHALREWTKSYFPSGSGFDSGTGLILDESTPEKIVICADFHHMNENGFYDGWTDHTVIVTPSLAFGFNLKVTGKNKNGIKDYIAEVFSHVLAEEIPPFDYKSLD